MSSDEEILSNDSPYSSMEYNESTEDSLLKSSSASHSVDLTAEVRGCSEMGYINLPNPPPQFLFTRLPSTNCIVDEGDLLYFNVFFLMYD